MSESKSTEPSPNQAAQTESPRSANLDRRAAKETIAAPRGDEPSNRKSFAWRPALIIAAIVIIGSGVFVTHQLLTYGALLPSIAGGWYGPFAAVRSDIGQYVTDSSLYVEFATGPGNQLTVTSSICSTSANAVDKQPPTASVTATGTLNGTHFTLPTYGGDNESNLAWAGTYSTDKVHIDFYPNGNPTPRSPYANLQRGTYDDFLSTCKVR